MLDMYIQYCQNNEEVINWVSTVLAATLKKDSQISQTEIEHILDYLKSDKAPKRLRRMSYAQAKISTKKWNDQLIKKAGGIVETEEDVKVVRSYKNGNKFVQLVGRAAFQREGNLMRHCVASYYGKSDVKIYSFRDNKNSPHCTIEVVANEAINQVKGKGNGSIHPKYIKYIIDFLSNHLSMEIREHEMENLGYFWLPDDQLEVFNKYVKDYKYIIIKNKMFIYSNQKFKTVGSK